MASINPAPAASAQLPSEFKTEYHPRSGCLTLFQPFNEFRTSSDAQHNVPIINDEPWHPFRSRGDFEFSEIAIEAALNKSQINPLLSLITCISEVPVTYKKDEQVYEVHAWPIWDWALDLLDNPLLVPQFVWDACCVYKRNDTEFECFFDEPWTGDRWWDIQSSLPDVDSAVLFCFVLYADKTKLSSHGTVKGYPVMNGEAFGGGRVIGWLPIVPEDAGEEGKLGYTTLKCVVWHESFFKLLELAAQYSKTGYLHKCHNNIVRWLFPVILILSADYEEQCMMSLICGRNGKCPCPMCLVPLAELHDLSKTYPLRSMEKAKEALRVYRRSKAQGEELLKILGLRPVENVFWIILYSDPHDALSFDRLHVLHAGLWKHLLGELKKILASLGREAEAAFEKLISNFPRWRNLNHFKSVINVSFTDRNKYQDLSKQAFYAGLNILTSRASQEGHQLLRVISTYLQLDSLIGLDVHTEGMLAAIEAKLLVFDTELKAYVTCVESSDIEKLKLNWDFPKTHLWKHVVHDIRRKGAAHNYTAWPLKDTYHYRTNEKDVAAQILCVDHHKFSLMLLREHVDMVDEHNWLQVLGDDLPDEDVDVTFNGHVKMGAPIQHPSSILDLENHSSVDRIFQAFRRKFTEFINRSLPTYGYQLTNWITFPADYQIHEHCYLKVNYESMVDWKQAANHLRCNPQFHRSPRFDHAPIQLTVDETIFVHLIFLFRCCILNLGSFEFALVQPYTARINSAHRTDRFFKLTRVKAVPRASSIFVPLNSFI
ncbi:uncharacterized protein F5891DRAFT_1128989 [Suillus fuscotomentosus]|uniref:Uncharacterized protein n=1 Tax=Suillus fuscotomentosus TaxID=1912939 RepID=A0AAD4HKC6_9AGAM|nr:uncharacterized protein F5891DRAFT_1128989 [Suillus fuscotomentosus]KAG1899351.1 hypothetical protein F5891DRAFT_1128989 [Suillus fuscotomentosus]